MRHATKAIAGLAAILATHAAAASSIVITEFMYNPASSPGEFIELTNIGSSAVDMTGWSEDDNDRTVGVHSLSGFGVVNPGQSVILTEADPAAFRTAWNLSSSVEVLGNYSNDNLGRSDEINIYSANGALDDRLTYNDQGSGNVAGPRTNGVSARPASAAALGANDASSWILSTPGDADGAYRSSGGDIGSPGTSIYGATPVPLPAAVWLFATGLGALFTALRRRKNHVPLGQVQPRSLTR